MTLFLSGCCKATMVQKTELKFKPLSKPFSQLNKKQREKVTFWHYCDRCKKPAPGVEWVKYV